jgi:3-methyladenine DNA glycosylase/8-oxoguanine DNA glycosylase
VAVRVTLAALGRGRGDPCHRVGADGTVWRATRTPDGPALLSVRALPAAGEVVAAAWGPGADWVLEGLPLLLGAADDDRGFAPAPEHPRLVAAHRARPGWRVGRSRAVFEALAGAALDQRVTGLEASRGWRRLVTAYGDPAPGTASPEAAAAAGMRVPPAPPDWRRIPTAGWLRAGVDERRRAVVLAAAVVAGRLEQTLELDVCTQAGQIASRLMSLPGVGPWTAAEVRQRAHGDPDAFSFGDYHAGRDVSWALTGEALDDEGCAGVIARYAGHRFRVQRLLELDGARRPRHGPRRSLPAHLPG